jgi:transposase
MTTKQMDVPASSPDINPIENVWSALKDTLYRVVKPKTKQELVMGIVKFWDNLDNQACGRYIDHIYLVLPELVLNNGAPIKYAN